MRMRNPFRRKMGTYDDGERYSIPPAETPSLLPWKRARQLQRRNDELMVANRTLLHQLAQTNKTAAELLSENVSLFRNNSELSRELENAREMINDHVSH
jgi:hypothetical protein